VLSQLGMDVVGEVADAESLVAMAHLEEPDLVLTDIRMPLTGTDDGLRAALRIRALRPRTAVVVLSQFVQRRYAVELLADHAAGVGYLLKQRILDVPALCRELRRVAAGGTALDPEVVALMTRSLSDDEALDSLTPPPPGGPRADLRGPQQRRHRRPAAHLREGRRRAHLRHL
jgi:DNA-binding NarL/FixJ family response regulator